MKIETLAVHAGYSPDPTTKSAAVPLYQTVAYAFDSAQHGQQAPVACLQRHAGLQQHMAQQRQGAGNQPEQANRGGGKAVTRLVINE